MMMTCRQHKRAIRCGAALAAGVIAWLSTATPAQAMGEYLLDDGSCEHLIGAEATASVQLATWWANAFDTAPGGDLILSINVVWGNDGDLATGDPATVLLYNDPTNDYDPSDLELLTAATTIMYVQDEDLFHIVPIQPTLVDGVFFAAVLANHSNGSHPACVDTDTIMNRSFLGLDFANSIDPANPTGTAMHWSAYSEGNLMLRAGATTITQDTVVANDDFAPGDTVGELGYQVGAGVNGLVEIIDDPNEAGDGVMRLYDPGDDPVNVSRTVAMDLAIVIDVVYQFLTDGKLDVLIDGQVIDTIVAPADGDGRDVPDLYQRAVNLADLGLDRGNHLLSFELSNDGDPELLIDSVLVRSSIPEPAALMGLLVAGLWMGVRRR